MGRRRVGEKKKERKKSPEGKTAAAYGSIRCVDVVKWLVRKCERDNDRLCMTPHGSPKYQTPLPSLSFFKLVFISDALQRKEVCTENQAEAQRGVEHFLSYKKNLTEPMRSENSAFS